MRKRRTMNSIKYSSELPYPQIQVTQNLSQAKLLMPLYAGVSSELTAVLTYCFQSYISTKHPDIAHAIECIAKVEMLHHKLLGKTIYALGGYPIMGARTYWSGNYANYTLPVKKFLEDDILAEKNTISNYEQTILNIENESVKTLLERIILDEEIHIEVLKSLLEGLN